MKIRCLLVDDEPLALSVLEKYICKIHDMEIVAKCESAIQAFEILQTDKKVDLIFLDIQMPELSGIKFLKTLENPPVVVITSAYREYALEGFEMDVLDYLLKPVSFERFLKSINKYYRLVTPESHLIDKIITTASNTDEYILVKEKKSKVKVPLKEICFIESQKDYIRIVMNDREVLTKMFISDVEKHLPEDRFLRIHRSFIVPVYRIDSFSANHVDIGKHTIPIGRSYKAIVARRLIQQ